MTETLRGGDDTFVAGLRAYAAVVAAAVGVGLESCCLGADDEATIYLAVDHQVAGFAGRDVALLWDERIGWAVAVETASGEDMVLVAVYPADLLPAPGAVARWFTRVADGDSRSVTVRDRRVDYVELQRQLSSYIPAYGS
jgi:hypothetical protein